MRVLIAVVIAAAMTWACSAAPAQSAGAEGGESAASEIDALIRQVSLDSTDLDSLSDEALIDLYVVASQASLREQSIDATRLVAPGMVILQAGYTYTYDRDDLDFTWETHTFPETLLRYRICDDVELRIGWAGTTVETVTDELLALSDRDRFYADPSVGARFSLHDQQDWIPRTAITVSSPVELKSSTSLASRFSPLTTLSYTWLVGDAWLLSGSSGVALVTDGNERSVDFQQAVSVDRLINEQWDVFVEWFAMYPDGSSAADIRHFAGPGISWAVTPRLQLGLSGSFGLNEAASDFTGQVRVTWRP